MDTTLLSSWNWAQEEFSKASLGDRRRGARLVRVASALARNPGGALHGALPSWAEVKAAYRLLERKEVTHEAVLATHQGRTRDECRRAGEILLVEDTTSLDFTTHYMTEGLGRIGDDGGSGFHLHSTLALRIERWDEEIDPQITLVGLFAQQCWARTMPTIGSGKEKRVRRLNRDRESQRWAAALEVGEGPSEGTRWTYMADRESDIYEVFEKCRSRGVDWIVRANQPRALAEADGSVFTVVAESARLGSYALDLRARPGHKRRTARIEVRGVRTTLRGPWRPGGTRAPVEVNVVEAREVDPPAGVEPIHWVLLTSWSIGTFAAALRVIKAYTRRWLIEEYHKALKTGAGVEESQLTTAHSLKALIGMLAVVAVRLLKMKLLAIAHPDAPVEPEEIGADAQVILEKKFGRPAGGWTRQTVMIAIAKVGGFLARKHDGNPGWISLWRGWHRLMLMVQGFALALGR